MEKKITILGFAGSLRKGSFNRSLLRAALEMVPKDANLVTFDLEGVPPFNQDLEGQPPEKVKEFKAQMTDRLYSTIISLWTGKVFSAPPGKKPNYV